MNREFSDKPMRPVWRRWLCGLGECQGEMKFTGEALTSNPPRYRHACEACGRSENDRTRYPGIVYLPIAPEGC
jgi:hypothetical protein